MGRASLNPTGTYSPSPADARQILDDHFRDLGVRIGVVQPRSPVAKHKHIELQADTLRVLAYSLLDKIEC